MGHVPVARAILQHTMKKNPCINCGKIVRLSTHKYCSQKCYWENKRGMDVPGGYKNGHATSNTGRTHLKSKDVLGDKNVNWKGKSVGYVALHSWMKRTYGKPKICENTICKYPRFTRKGILLLKPKQYEWANITGKYDRERNNWARLCSHCHRLLDKSGVVINL